MSPTPFPATLTTRDGLKLHTRHWPLDGARAVAVIAHGLGEHAARYEPVAAALRAQGLAVVAHDHRGHGRSEGGRGQLRRDDDLLWDLAALIDAARAACPGLPLLLIGHSMGGVLAARFAAELIEPDSLRAPWSRPIDALMLSSPALALPLSPVQKALMATVARWLPDIAVGNGLKPEWVCHNPDTVAAYKADPLVHDRISGRLSHFMLAAGHLVRARAARWVVPTLILWGGEDRCVAPQGSADFLAAAQQGMRAGTSAPVEGQCFQRLSHEIFLEREQAQVLGVLTGWIGRVFGG